MFSFFRLVFVGDPYDRPEIAHFLRTQNEVDEYIIHSLGKLKVSEHHPWTSGQRVGGVSRSHREGPSSVYADLTYPGQFRPTTEMHRESGIMIWAHENGERFIFHQGYDVLIPPDGWPDWLRRWEAGEINPPRR